MYVTNRLAVKRKVPTLRGLRGMGDTCVIDPQTGGRVCTAPAAGVSQGVNYSVPPELKPLWYQCQHVGGRWENSRCIYEGDAYRDTDAVMYDRTPQPVISQSDTTPFSLSRSNKPSRYGPSPVTPAPATPAPSATPSTAPALATWLNLEFLKESTWITGVPNWAVALGGAAGVYALLGKKQRY